VVAINQTNRATTPHKSPILQPATFKPNPSIKRLFNRQSINLPHHHQQKSKQTNKQEKVQESQNINSPLSRRAQHTTEARKGKGESKTNKQTNSSKEQGTRNKEMDDIQTDSN
jgi:hypothetical protein